MLEQARAQWELRDYIAVLRRQRWIIGLTVVVVVAVGVGTALLRTPMYLATAEIAVETAGGLPTDDALARVLVGEIELETQRRILTGGVVVAAVVERLGLDAEPARVERHLDVELIEDTRVLLVHYRDADPDQAATVAQTVAETYLELRRAEAIERVLATRKELLARTEALRARLDELGTDAGTDPVVEAERSSLQQQLGEISAQLAALEATDELVRGGGEIIRAAAVPSRPVEPDPVRRGLVALGFGLLLGVTLAFVRDLLDDAIRSEHDAVRATDGAPVLAQVPRWTLPKGTNQALPTVVAPTSPAAEAFHTLRTNLRYLVGETRFRSVLVTSATDGEGRTAVAANLAIAAARVGTDTLLVDADLRRPAVHTLFRTDREQGLSDLIAGEDDLEDLLRQTSVANLRIVTAGAAAAGPAELLASDAATAVLAELGSAAELVIIDSPSILAVADTIELAPRASAVILVVESGRSRRRAVRSASQRLVRVGGTLVGTVLTRAEPD